MDGYKRLFVDRKFRVPRLWSNRELRRFAHLFTGDVVNVSGWRDSDKEGGLYKDYFKNAKSYTITNYKSEAKGYQGFDNEIFLDLEKPLPKELIRKFDVVYNHTTLEHIYDFKKAFENICLMSRDIVIIVVPFLQQMHADYGDYWRFTPLAMKRMFEDNGMKVLYSSFNEDKLCSVYLFFIATRKNIKKWDKIIRNEFEYKAKNKFAFDHFKNYVGCRSIKNSYLFHLVTFVKYKLRVIRKWFQ